MIVVVVLSVAWLACGALVAWRAGRIGWRNLQGFRRELHVEPLEVDEVLADLPAPAGAAQPALAEGIRRDRAAGGRGLLRLRV